MATKRNTPGVRVLRPKGKHKSFRFQFQKVAGGEWLTKYSEEIEAFNSLYLSGVISLSDVEARIAPIKASLYKERDKGRAILLAPPGNLKIFQAFLEHAYPSEKRLRIEDTSFESASNYLRRAVEALSNLPVDGDIAPLQALLDKTFKSRPTLHHQRVMALNRMRRWLGLTPAMHLRPEQVEVEHLPLKSIEALLPQLAEPYRTLVGVAIYTGLRRGEIFGLKPQDLLSESTLNVMRQITPGGEVRKPKNRKVRKAFILKGGAAYVRSWLSMKKEVGRNAPVGRKWKELSGIRFHDLRHSYAIHLIGSGATLEWVSQSLGNSREVCEKFYSGFLLSNDAISLLEKLMDKKDMAG